MHILMIRKKAPNKTKIHNAPTCPILESVNHFSMLYTTNIDVIQNMVERTITPEKLLRDVYASAPNATK